MLGACVSLSELGHSKAAFYEDIQAHSNAIVYTISLWSSSAMADDRAV